MASEIMDSRNMMYIGETPWHGLGTYVGEEPVTSDIAIKMSGLDWAVKKQPVFTMKNGSEFQPVPGYNAIVREDNDFALGVVGSRYEPVQNIQCFSFADNLIQDGNMRYHTAGFFRNGEQIWLLGKIGSVELLKEDIRDKYLLLMNSHDGSKAVQVMFTNVRVLCKNTARMAESQAEKDGGIISIRHTLNADQKLEQTRKLLQMALAKFEAQDEFLKHLAGIMWNSVKMQNFLNDVFPVAEGKEESTQSKNNKNLILHLFNQEEIPAAKGTAYAALEAVIKNASWMKQSRGGQGRRFESLILGSGNAMVQRAWDSMYKIAA